MIHSRFTPFIAVVAAIVAAIAFSNYSPMTAFSVTLGQAMISWEP
jgi:hypothetical protein